MTDTAQKSRIPKLKTIEDEAAFWDTHSFADYLDELKPVKVKFALRKDQPLSVRSKRT